MTRPQHLNCVNTSEGIRRINEDQRHYDEDPDGYERERRIERENYERDQEAERQYHDTNQTYGMEY